MVIFIVGALLRFNALESIPPGLNRDEVSVGYNAYSILQTGKDEHGRKYPLYFEALGDQKLPGIIYITVPSIKLFGLTPFGVRFPFALLGSLTVIGVFLLARYGMRDTKLPSWFPHLCAVMIAINPWHMYHSRAAYVVCLGLFFFTFATYFFLKGLKSPGWMMASITFFAAAMYSYSLTRLLAPLLFITFCFINRQDLQRYSRNIVGFFLAYIIVLSVPFLMTAFDAGGITSPKGAVVFTSSQSKATLVEFRSYLLHTQMPWVIKLFFNSPIMLLYEYLKNILSAISLRFLFVSGAGPGGAGIGTIGQFYMHEVIALVLGFIAIAKNKKLKQSKFVRMMVGWTILALLCASLTINPPDSYASRMYFIIAPLIILMALGWTWGLTTLTRQKKWKFLAVSSLVVIYLWQCTYYLTSYYFRFPIVYAHAWDSRTSQLYDYLKKYEDSVDYIVITKPEKSRYAFQLFYQHTDPTNITKEIKRYPPDPDGWKHVEAVGKYQYRSINWDSDNTASTSAILVSEGDEYLDHMSVTHEIYYPEKNAVYAHGQQIIAHSQRPVAFRIWHVTRTQKQ